MATVAYQITELACWTKNYPVLILMKLENLQNHFQFCFGLQLAISFWENSSMQRNFMSLIISSASEGEML